MLMGLEILCVHRKTPSKPSLSPTFRTPRTLSSPTAVAPWAGPGGLPLGIMLREMCMKTIDLLEACCHQQTPLLVPTPPPQSGVMLCTRSALTHPTSPPLSPLLNLVSACSSTIRVTPALIVIFVVAIISPSSLSPSLPPSHPSLPSSLPPSHSPK